MLEVHRATTGPGSNSGGSGSSLFSSSRLDCGSSVHPNRNPAWVIEKSLSKVTSNELYRWAD